MFVWKYVHVIIFCGYHRPMKINLYEYLTHKLFSHKNFPINGSYYLQVSEYGKGDIVAMY